MAVEELIPEQRVYLSFEGANQETNVFVNGTFVGNHKGGYSAFTFDVTDYVHAGRNLIAVSVDNSHNPDIAPLSADFTFFGGIYRDVYLVYTSPVQLSTTHYASSGVYLKASKITDLQADISVKTFLSNALKSNQSLILETEILDADGNRVALSQKKVNVKAEEKNVAFESLMAITQPKRWDVDSPYMYKVYSRLKNKKRRCSIVLSIRWEFVNIVLMRRKVFLEWEISEIDWYQSASGLQRNGKCFAG